MSSLASDSCRLAADRTIGSLRKRLQRILHALTPRSSDWAGYESARTHYTEQQLVLKRSTLDRLLGDLRPARVLDVGTNNGEFARLASQRGSSVVSIDQDLEALRGAQRKNPRSQDGVLYLHVDFTAPSPALGWNGAECQSFDVRSSNYFDLVMALAVLHHIIISGQIPLADTLDKLAAYSKSHLLIEYIDPTDVMFMQLASSRQRDFSWLNEDLFRRMLSERMIIEERIELVPGRRTLYLCAHTRKSRP